jgi:hypothetical protein
MSVQTVMDTLPEDWTTQFLAMYDDGCSDFEVMRQFGITPKQWQMVYSALGESEFQEVVEYGHALARAWWEAQGRTNLTKRGFNVRLYDINMQNRYDWARKAENTDGDTVVGAADDASLSHRIKELESKYKVSESTET